MTERKQETDRLNTLRQRAEAVLRERPDALRAVPPEDIQTLIHDLEVHQVELEMQNEELRRIQRELEQARDRYIDLYDFAPVGYLTISESGLILEANLTAATMLGVARGHMLKKNIGRFIAHQDQDSYYFYRRKLFETHEPQVCEMRMVRQDDRQFWARIHASASVDSEGQAVCRATMSDITERKQAEEALRQYTERLKIQHEIDTAILAAQSPEAIARAALSRLQRLVPCRYTGITEVDWSQQQGRDLIVLVDGELQVDKPGWHPLTNASSQLLITLQRGRTYIVEDIAALSAPSTIEQALLANRMRSYISIPLLAQGLPIGTLSLASDTPNFFQARHIEILEEVAASLAIALQQARLLEQTQRDAETKTLLLHEVNHRVLNNLTMILSILDMEQRRSLENKTDFQAALRDIASRIGGMTTVHRMLSSAQWAPLSLSEVVAKVIHAALSASPIRQHVEVLVEAPDNPLRVMPKQAITIALIINELTTNSIKYAFRDRAQGRIHVQVTALGEDDGRKKVQIIFRDDGPGLPDEVLTGERQNVGLWLVKTNIEHNLRGNITLHNEDGIVASIRFDQHIGEKPAFMNTRR